MNRYIIGSLWDRDNRNGANKNFEYLFEGSKRIDELNSRADNILSETERVNKENVSTQKQIDDLILSDGESDAEVIQARGQYPLLKDRLDMDEYKTAELVQNIESDINEEFNNIVKHRPIHVGQSIPSNTLGNDGDLYIQTYGADELEFYEEGSFTPYITGSSSDATGVTYSKQTGHFTRVGNLVTVTLDIEVSSKGSSGAGQLQVYALPYSAEYEHFIPFSGELRGYDLGTGQRVVSALRIGASSSNFFLRHYSIQGDINQSWVSWDSVTDGMRLMTSFSYISSGRSTGL